jgi:hypothetical protein
MVRSWRRWHLRRIAVPVVAGGGLSLGALL